MGLRERLGRLEAELRAPGEATRPETPAYLERYFRGLENIRRKETGEPLLPYTALDRQGDEECLRETIPAYRRLPTWQTDEAREFLDLWERDVRDRLERRSSSRTRCLHGATPRRKNGENPASAWLSRTVIYAKRHYSTGALERGAA